MSASREEMVEVRVWMRRSEVRAVLVCSAREASRVEWEDWS